jgi:hypothetical protein
MFDHLDALLEPALLFPLLSFLGLCLLSTWALYRATARPKKRYEDGDDERDDD